MPREKVADFIVGDRRQPDAGERGGDALFADAGGEAHEPRRIVQIVGRGEMIVEADRVRQIADQALNLERLAHRIVPEDARLSGADVA